MRVLKHFWLERRMEYATTDAAIECDYFVIPAFAGTAREHI
jgi:hypothetical protein